MGYKDSGVAWLGQVPVGWEVIRFGRIFKGNKRKNIGLKETNVLSLSYGNIKEKNIDENKGLLPESFETYQIIEPDDIIFRFTDLQNDKKSLRSAISKYHGIITSAYISVKTEQNANFYNYLFRAYDLQKVFYAMGDGMRQSLKMDELNKMLILLPPLPTQIAIADYLDQECQKIDTLVEVIKTLIAQMREYKKAIIAHTVTKGLDDTIPTKDSGVAWLGQVPVGWEVGRIKDFCRLVTQKTSKKTNVIALENIESWSGKFIESESDFESDAIKFEKNDILFGKLRPYLAKVYLTKNSGQALGDLYVLRPNNLAYPEFFRYLIVSENFIELVNSSTNGAKMPRANWEFLSSIQVYIPPLPTQIAIANYLDKECTKMDNLIHTQSTLIAKLNEYKKSLISSAVTGKLEIV